MEIKLGQVTIRIIQGDITEQPTDAIVNAANPSLMGGGGVDGAIHRKGGPRILEECKDIRANEFPDGLPTGRAVITSGGRLRARHVIHTVGPVWQGGKHEEDKLLGEAYRNSLNLALEKGLKTVAFPSISTGAYGYPVEQASRIALKTIREFAENQRGLEEIVLVLFSRVDFDVYEKAAKELFKHQTL